MKEPTMTLHECAEAFRANRISISEARVADGIYSGQFAEFAVPLVGKSSRCPMIFRRRFYRWLGAMLEEDPVEI